MSDLVSHRPGRVTVCSLSGEGWKVNPCPTTRASDRCQCWAMLGTGETEERERGEHGCRSETLQGNPVESAGCGKRPVI